MKKYKPDSAFGFVLKTMSLIEIYPDAKLKMA